MKAIEKALNYIKENGGLIEEAPKGKVFLNFPSGKPIRTKKAKFVVTFKGLSTVGQVVDSCLISLHKSNKINLFDFGFNACSRCGGSGSYGNGYYSTCRKCNGFGFISR